MNSFIIVGGDSWAVGEWTRNPTLSGPPSVTHNGLRQYLSDDGRQNISLGYPGLGSIDAVNFLDLFIQQNTSIKINKIVFFQSDWIRDVHPERWQNNNHLPIFQNGYLQTREYYISFLYRRLSSFYKNFGISSIVVGGQGDAVADDQVKDKYPGVTIGCQSFTNLIHNNDSTIERPAHSVFQHGGTATGFINQEQFKTILNLMRANSDSANLRELVADMEIAVARDKIFSKHFPDGRHPDRGAHKKLYQHLKDKNLL